uniref:Uncharacterized protein n=1 Tax=Cannabis sativa TaxID=3483 RepID=A0A803P2L3_CANSA
MSIGPASDYMGPDENHRSKSRARGSCHSRFEIGSIVDSRGHCHRGFKLMGSGWVHRGFGREEERGGGLGLGFQMRGICTVQLEEEEEGVLITSDQGEENQAFDDIWCLVGKFLTGRTIDFDAMRHMMALLVISDTQGASLSRCLILDNVMISFEIMRYLKRKRMGKEGHMALKLDMSKVITHGGHVFGPNTPSRANDIEAANVLNLLAIHEHAYGQKVNFAKSFMFFSNNTKAGDRVHICNLLGMPAASEHSSYLGLPRTMGRSKNASLGFLKEKMKKKILSWEPGNMFFSRGVDG